MWLLYGANGTTGQLLLSIWQKASFEVPAFYIAGRNAPQLQMLGQKYGLPHLTFSLDELATTRIPEEVQLIVNFAGPYTHTAGIWVSWCQRRRVAYLDICGEWRLFQRLYQEASQAQVPLITAAGFDTVVGEAALYFLRQKYPHARHLALFVYARGGFSAGTVRSALSMLTEGYHRWEKGHLHSVPFTETRRQVRGKTLSFFSASLAELITFPAWNPDVDRLEAWVALPPSYLRRRLLLERFFAWKPLHNGLLRLVDSQRARLAREMDLSQESWVFAEAEEAPERLALRTPQPYVFTAWTVLRSVERFFAEGAEPGPASAFSRWREKLWGNLSGAYQVWEPRSSPA